MSQTAQVGPPQKRKVRIFTWIILVINVLFAVWLIAGIVGVSNSECTGNLSQSSCDAAKSIGGGIGALLIVFLWMATDVILGIIWLVTRKREPAQVVYVQQPYNSPQGQPYHGPQGQPYSGPQGQPYSGPQGQPYSGPQGQPYSGPQGQPYSGPQGQPYNGPQGQPYNGPQGQPYNGPQ